MERPRVLGDRVAGCCRDHALLVVGALRQRGVPARSRVGFAHCFTPGWAHDHVVVERWERGRWRRADPELTASAGSFDVLDLPVGDGAPFETAAQAWLGWRAGERDASRYGVAPGAPWCGPGFVRDEVLHELAHRHGDELLLWDGWGAVEDPGSLALEEVDELARLLVLADGGDEAAEADLAARYRGDERLHPGEQVVTRSPFGGPARLVDLARRSTTPL
nr:transglutaminase domain-containing protein [Kineococcus vitellinus]